MVDVLIDDKKTNGSWKALLLSRWFLKRLKKHKRLLFNTRGQPDVFMFQPAAPPPLPVALLMKPMAAEDGRGARGVGTQVDI